MTRRSGCESTMSSAVVMPPLSATLAASAPMTAGSVPAWSPHRDRVGRGGGSGTLDRLSHPPMVPRAGSSDLVRRPISNKRRHMRMPSRRPDPPEHMQRPLGPAPARQWPSARTTTRRRLPDLRGCGPKWPSGSRAAQVNERRRADVAVDRRDRPGQRADPFQRDPRCALRPRHGRPGRAPTGSSASSSSSTRRSASCRSTSPSGSSTASPCSTRRRRGWCATARWWSSRRRDVVLDDLIELRTGDEVPADGVLLTSDGTRAQRGEPHRRVRPGATTPRRRDPVGHERRRRFRALPREARSGADAYVNRIAADARKFTRTRSEIQESINTLLTLHHLGHRRRPAAADLVAVARPSATRAGSRSSSARRPASSGSSRRGSCCSRRWPSSSSAVQLTRRSVLVQQLPAVEGLARVDVVCLDKTGTLTVGEIAFERRQASSRGYGRGRDPLCAGRARRRPQRQRHAGRDRRGASRRPAGTARGRSRSTPQRKWSAACFEEHETWVLGAPEVLLADGDPAARRASPSWRAAGDASCSSRRSAEHLDEPVAPRATSPRRRS